MAAHASEFEKVHGTFEGYTDLLWIRDKLGALIPLNLNRMQRMTREAKLRALEQGRPPRFVELKYRRGGMSTLEIGENCYRAFTWMGQNVVTLAHTSRQTEILFRIAETYYQNLPDPLRPRRKSTNKREIDLPFLRSLYYIGTAGSRGFGRGDTIQRVHWSEVAWSNFEDGLLVGLEEACSHGPIVLESTANGPSGLFHDIVQEAAGKGYSKWTLIFLPWFVDPTNRMRLAKGESVVPGEPHNEISVDFCQGEAELIEMAAKDWGVLISPEQLKWRRHKWHGTKPRPEFFFQEYPETWRSAFVSAAGMFFDAQALEAGLAACAPPVVRESYQGGEFLAWEEPREHLEYVAGADSSEGRPEGDASYLSIVEVETGRQVARWYGRARPEVFGGQVIPRYANRYNHAFTGIERNNHGHAVVRACTIEGGYWNLHSYRRTGADGEPEDVYGWDTNGQTRPMLCDLLYDALTEGWLTVHDQQFWNEAFNFRLKDAMARPEKARYEAPKHVCSGRGCPKHDDTLFGHGIALEMRRRRSVVRIRS